MPSPSKESRDIPDYRVGDKVIYVQDDEQYTIEKEIIKGVFLIGNQESFCDMVPSHLLRKANA